MSFGSEKYPSYGIIIKSDTLYALIAYKNNAAWQVTLIPKAASYQLGGTTDFLGDFQNSAIEPTDIRCTSPQTDPDISLKINGKYVAPLATHFLPVVKHLCFSASNTYNDWVCESIDPSTHKVARTFIQMNAD